MKTLVLACFAAVFAPIAVQIAHGETAFANVSGTPTNPIAELGYTFTLANPIRVTQLGCFDYLNNDMDVATPVTIWDNAGTSLANVIVPAGTNTGEINSFLYVTLATPVTLSAGTYTIAVFEGSHNDSTLYNAAFTPAAGITYGTPRSSPSNNYPTGDSFGFTGGYLGPNFQFAVPEPSTWAVLGLGVAGLGMTLRRRAICAYWLASGKR